MRKNKLVLFLSLFSFFTPLFAYTIDIGHLPQIPKLSSRDELFKEYSSVVESNYKLVSAGKTPEGMFFLYENTENFTNKKIRNNNIFIKTVS